MYNTNVKVYRSIIKEFLENHPDLHGIDFSRKMHIHNGTMDMFIFELPEWKGRKKTSVFDYDCGQFYECRTEYDTFNKYLFSLATECDFMELSCM